MYEAHFQVQKYLILSDIQNINLTLNSSTIKCQNVLGAKFREKMSHFQSLLFFVLVFVDVFINFCCKVNQNMGLQLF